VGIDLQTVVPQDAIPINNVKYASVRGIGTLDVTGEDFRSVDDVMINDISSPDVVVLSKTRLLAQLPDSLQRNPDVRSVLVLSRTFTVTSKSLLRFRIGDTPGRTQGINRLVQLFIKLLLSNPGSDRFNRQLGGGALKNVGSNFDAVEGNTIKADFTIAIDRTARQIISLQSRDGSLPADERLLSATLVGATFSRASAALFINVELVPQSGRPARLNLEV